MLRYLLFDLDETLYTPGTGLWEAIGNRIILYMTERLGLSVPEAEALRARYRQQYGIALAGLLADYAINPDDYMNSSTMEWFTTFLTTQDSLMWN